MHHQKLKVKSLFVLKNNSKFQNSVVWLVSYSKLDWFLRTDTMREPDFHADLYLMFWDNLILAFKMKPNFQEALTQQFVWGLSQCKVSGLESEVLTKQKAELIWLSKRSTWRRGSRGILDGFFVCALCN